MKITRLAAALVAAALTLTACTGPSPDPQVAVSTQVDSLVGWLQEQPDVTAVTTAQDKDAARDEIVVTATMTPDAPDASVIDLASELPEQVGTLTFTDVGVDLVLADFVVSPSIGSDYDAVQVESLLWLRGDDRVQTAHSSVLDTVGIVETGDVVGVARDLLAFTSGLDGSTHRIGAQNDSNTMRVLVSTDHDFPSEAVAQLETLMAAHPGTSGRVDLLESNPLKVDVLSDGTIELPAILAAASGIAAENVYLNWGGVGGSLAEFTPERLAFASAVARDEGFESFQPQSGRVAVTSVDAWTRVQELQAALWPADQPMQISVKTDGNFPLVTRGLAPGDPLLTLGPAVASLDGVVQLRTNTEAPSLELTPDIGDAELEAVVSTLGGLGVQDLVIRSTPPQGDRATDVVSIEAGVAAASGQDSSFGDLRKRFLALWG